VERPAQLQLLLEKMLGGADPGERLGAVAELRRELENVETELAADALRRGWSWSRIGSALGVSKQAAHRRHSRTVASLDRAAEAQHAGTEVLVSAEARQAVRLARREAAAMGKRAVGTEHLLLGVLQSGDATTTDTLRRYGGLTVALVRQAVQPTTEIPLAVAAAAAAADASGSRGSEAGRPPPSAVLSPLARRVLERALHERAQRAAGSLSSRDLLFALLEHDNAGAARTLRTLGVDAEMLRLEIAPERLGRAAQA
jgi:ATP-dependent Clp protease ATP-binding subunit ClpA